ncbi:MAG TPA: protein phosphatase 2C domain-containing protein [Candidatus Saccharimonadales bacterium]|nr:protein phosphatase 2C domain-containing protein [Candidatus Saccharimonadales bacterium]
MNPPVGNNLHEGAPGTAQAERQHLTPFGQDQLRDPASARLYTESAYPLSEEQQVGVDAALGVATNPETNSGEFPAGATLLSYGGALQTGEGTLQNPKDALDCQDRMSFDANTGRGAIADGVGGRSGGGMAAGIAVSSFMEGATKEGLEQSTSIAEAQRKLQAISAHVDDALARGKDAAAMHKTAAEKAQEEITGQQGAGHLELAAAATTLSAFQVTPSTEHSNARLMAYNAGDTAIIHIGPNRYAQRLTTDHSEARLMPDGTINRNGIANYLAGKLHGEPTPNGRPDRSADDRNGMEMPAGPNIVIAVTDGILGNDPTQTLTVEDIGNLAFDALDEAGIDVTDPNASQVISETLVNKRLKTYDDGGALTTILNVEDVRGAAEAKQVAKEAAAQRTEAAEKAKGWSKFDRIRPSTLVYAALARLQANAESASAKTGRDVYRGHSKVKRGLIKGSFDYLPAALVTAKLGSAVVRTVAEHKGWGSFDFAHDLFTGNDHGGGHNTSAEPWQSPVPEATDKPPTVETSDPGVVDHPKPEQPAHDTPLPRREALAHDTIMGHKTGASNMTRWAQDYLYDSMKDRGATDKQASAAAHNPAHIHAAMEAFRDDNKSVGSKGWLYAHEKYNVNGVDNVADKYADQWHDKHHPDTKPEAGTTKPDTTESADENTLDDSTEKPRQKQPEYAPPSSKSREWYEVPGTLGWTGIGATVSLGGIAAFLANRQRLERKYAPFVVSADNKLVPQLPHHTKTAVRVQKRLAPSGAKHRV